MSSVRKAIAHLVVSLAVLVIFLVNLDSPGLWFSDMPSHALNGVFYKDLIEDGAFFNPKTYAERYYVQYPSLTVGIYPPVFYIVEAAFFKFFGISAATAKLAVLFFSLVCANALLALYRQWFFLWISVGAVLLFLLQPTVLFGQKNVMLEIPLVAMSSLALYCLYSGTTKESSWLLFLAPLFCALAFLTRQSAVFLLPLGIIWLLWRMRWKAFTSVPLLLGTVCGIILLAPWLVVNTTAGRVHLGVLDFKLGHVWPNLAFYATHITDVVSIPVLVPGVLAIAFIFQLRQREGVWFALLWVVSVTAFLLPLKLSEPRYAIALVPAVVALAMTGVQYFSQRIKVSWKNEWVAAAIVFPLVFLHLFTQPVWANPSITGFHRAAEFVVRDGDCRAVLYDGHHNGNFIFHVRMADSQRRVFVFRASKVVYTTNFLVSLGYEELVQTRAAFHDLLKKYSIKYIVQEEADLLRTPANEQLRKWIEGEEFELVETFPISARLVKGFGRLMVYKYLDHSSEPIEEVVLHMPTLGRKMRVKIGKD